MGINPAHRGGDCRQGQLAAIAIQMIKLGATFQLYYVASILSSSPFSRQRLSNIISGSALSADGTGEKMRIHLANAIDVWRDFGTLETGRSEERRVGKECRSRWS